MFLLQELLVQFLTAIHLASVFHLDSTYLKGEKERERKRWSRKHWREEGERERENDMEGGGVEISQSEVMAGF